MRKNIFGAAACAALFCLVNAAPALAQHEHHAAAPTAPVALTEGTVKKIDMAAGQITLAHGPIENLGMSAMTMAFKVKEPKQIAALKVGDKVRFFADYVGSEMVITRIEAVK